MSSDNSQSVRLALVNMLHRCADYLAGLSPEEVEALLDGDLELHLSVVAKKAKVSKKAVAPLDTEQLADVSARLRAMDNRVDGEQLLREVAPTRAALEKLARHLDIAVRRDDRLDDLLRRIIESTIGYRLSSAAIHGRRAGGDRDDGASSISTSTKE